MFTAGSEVSGVKVVGPSMNVLTVVSTDGLFRGNTGVHLETVLSVGD